MYLLDTHVLIWAVGEPERLSPTVRRIIEFRQTKVSVASLWELLVKSGKKNAPVRNPLVWWNRHITRFAKQVLPTRLTHVTQFASLADFHRDPFDRILVAQSIVEKLQLVSADLAVSQYVKTVWTRLAGFRLWLDAQAAH